MEGKVLVNAYRQLLNIEIDLLIAVDSKDLYDTLSTCRNATDRSTRADVSVIRYEFETKNVSRMIWVSGKSNLADPLTNLTAHYATRYKYFCTPGLNIHSVKLRFKFQIEIHN